MALRTHDPRLTEADRHFSRWVQRGVPPKVVHALLPMLAGPLHTQHAAERFMAERGVVGHDLSPEGVAAERHLVAKAKALHQSALESGAFAGHGPVFQPPAGRYLPSEADTNSELDRQHPNIGYPHAGENARRLRLAEAEEQMQRKHRDASVYVEDDGSVYRTHPVTLQREKIDHVDLPPRRGSSDVSRFQHHQSDADLSNSDIETEAAWGFPKGVNRPFFLQ